MPFGMVAPQATLQQHLPLQMCPPTTRTCGGADAQQHAVRQQRGEAVQHRLAVSLVAA